MGNYQSSGRRPKRSVSEMFAEAEDEHFLDCPTADFFIRSGSLLLDGILFFLLLSGVQHINQAALSVLPKLPSMLDASTETVSFLRDTITYCTNVAKILVVYGYFIWPVLTFRGTPAKLLLGLRVVDANTGGKLSPVQVLLREVLGKALGVSLGGIGFLLPLFRSDHRALHDLVSQTVVKRVHGGP